MKKIQLLIAFLAINLALYSQIRTRTDAESSLVLSVGPSTLLIGDFGTPFKESYFIDLNSDKTQLINSSISVGFHQVIDEKFGYQFAVYSNNYSRIVNTNKFRSETFMLDGRLEYFIRKAYGPTQAKTYLFGGLGVVYSDYSKYTFTNSKTRNLEERNSVIAPEIPFGIGYRSNLTDKLTLGAELSAHYCLTDLIEGYQGAFPHDVLTTAAVTLSYNIFAGGRHNHCKCFDN